MSRAHTVRIGSVERMNAGARSKTVTRRAALAGLAAVALSACTRAYRRTAAPAVPLSVEETTSTTLPPTTTTTVAPTTTTTVPPTTTTLPEPATTIPLPAGLTVHPIPARLRPVYRVHDILPAAPVNAVALTIDDGPNATWTPEVLDVLAADGVKATFSVVGIHAVQYPALVRRIVAAGHAICNHTMTHPQPFVARSPAQIDAEIKRGTAAIYQTTGRVPTVFRSPGGEWNEHVLASCARMGQTPIDWDVDPKDWRRPGTAVITQRLLAARGGDILLCHDGGGDRSETVAALRTVLPLLRKRGLTFVTL